MTEADYNQLLIRAGDLTTWVSLVPLLVGWWFRRHWNRPIRMLYAFYVVVFCLNWFETWFLWYVSKYYETYRPLLEYWEIYDTNFLAILYYFPAFLLLPHFFVGTLPLRYKKVVLYTAWILLAAVVINYIFIEGYNTYGHFSPNARTLYILIFSGLSLWYIYRDYYNMPVVRNPYFWFHLSLFFPYLTALAQTLFAADLYDENFGMYVITNLVHNAVFAIGSVLQVVGYVHLHNARFLTRR